MLRRIEAGWTALLTAALTTWVFPALALAQSAPQGSAPAPQGSDPISRASGGANWIWVVAAIVVIALVWWALASRRRGGAVR